MGQRFEVPPIHLIEQKLGELRSNILESQQLYETTRFQLKNYLQSINNMPG